MGEEYYDKKFFRWQKEIGSFGGIDDLHKFEAYIGKTDDILDFGCGGGYLLKNIRTSGHKTGVEINENAKKTVIKNGVEYHRYIEEVADCSVDIVISHMALEHVEHPAHCLREMKRVIRPGGKIVVVVPHEILQKTGSGDTDMHLYTWSPQHMKNLMEFCGIRCVFSKRYPYLWPPGYRSFQRIFGWRAFRAVSILYGAIRRIYFTKAVGIVEKPECSKN